MRPFMIILAAILIPFCLLGQMRARKPDNNPQLKSIKESKVRLDSTITIRESTGSKEKTHFLYNSEGYNAECINYEFEKSTNKWVQSGIETCIYDSAWNLTSVITDGHIKEEFTYDKNGNLLTMKYDSKDVYVYDKDPNKIFAVIFGGENCIYYFDSVGKITNVRWAETDSLEFKYDHNDNIISRTHFFHDPPLCPLVVTENEEYNYDNNRNLITSISNYSQPSSLCPDGNLNLIRKSEYFYDLSYKNEDLILPYVFNFNPRTHYLDWSNTWNFLLDFKITERINYHNNQRIKYYYSEQTITGINENTQGKVEVFPNPATDFINLHVGTTLEPAKVEIYDNQGKLVVIEDIRPGKQLSVKHLQRGFYIYKVSFQNSVMTGKIILQ